MGIEIREMIEGREAGADAPEADVSYDPIPENSVIRVIAEFNAEQARHARQMAALRKWFAGGRKGLLAPELKAKWLELVLEHDGVEAAAREMDRLATHKMPEAMQ